MLKQEPASFPNGVIPQAAWSKPAIGILPFIPQGDPVTGAYTNNSQKDTVSDNKFGQRIDFFNRKTGNWYFYYHLDNSSAISALSGNNIPGFASITPTRAQEFVMSNNKTFGTNTVNEWRISFFRTATVTNKPKSGFAKLADLGFVTGPGLSGSYRRARRDFLRPFLPSTSRPSQWARRTRSPHFNRTIHGSFLKDCRKSSGVMHLSLEANSGTCKSTSAILVLPTETSTST